MRIPQTPISTWESRVADERSRNIFFVDVARSLGIEAQQDGVTGKVQYKKDGQWVDVDFETTQQQVAKTGIINQRSSWMTRNIILTSLLVRL